MIFLNFNKKKLKSQNNVQKSPKFPLTKIVINPYRIIKNMLYKLTKIIFNIMNKKL